MNSKHRRRESLWTKGFVAYTFLQMSLLIPSAAKDIHQRQVWVARGPWLLISPVGAVSTPIYVIIALFASRFAARCL